MSANLRRLANIQFLIVATLTFLVGTSHAQWVAYNDHAPGSGTSANATTYNIRSNDSGFLKDIGNGTNLPVILSITTNGPGPIIYGLSSATPATGTPLYNAFHGFVDFGTATDSTVAITNSTVTCTFTGLDPSKHYSFKGGAVRALTGTAASNRWTRVEIIGADSFVGVHSSNVITSAQAPGDLTASQAAANFAGNNTAVTGDMVGWDNIDPGNDGAFSIVCSQYQGFVPTAIIPTGGHSNGTNAFAITGIRLEELQTGPPVIGAQPLDQRVNSGEPATFSVTATGEQPLSYQWYRDTSMIPAATNFFFTISQTSIYDYCAKFSVYVSNALGHVISSNATLTIIPVPILVLRLTNSWKYNQGGTNLGTAWSAIGYDDSAWPAGPGVLAHEDAGNATVFPLINTVLSTNNAQGAYVNTFYFRTHFDLSAYDPEAITMTASNLIDDGALVYLNGHEIYRQNMIPAPNPVVYTTLANNSVEAAWTSFTVPVSFLIQGDNVLAAEVHQSTANSSDIVWGMILRGDVPSPTLLTITNNPADRTLTETASATFTVGFAGSQPHFQWYKWINGDPVPISGATHQNYSITNVALADAGYYFVTLSNSLGATSSSAALLTVLVDKTGPSLIGADGTAGLTNIALSFSEPVFPPSATNLANYYFTNVTSGGGIAVLSAILTNQTNVFLTLNAPRDPNQNYLLVVNNVQDTSPNHNSITADSAFPISSIVTLVRLDQPGWAFYNPVLGPPYESFEPPTNWNQVDFLIPQNDWGRDAAGLFAYNPLQTPLPAPVNTAISDGAISSYYRRDFDSAASPIGATFIFRHIVNDGMVGYLNGAEIYRFNMPSGPITPFIPANAPVIGASDSGNILLPGFSLLFGRNVFAAELHSTSTTDNTLVFGTELKARVFSWARGPVIITSGPEALTVTEGEVATFSFTGIGASGFQWQTNGISVAGAIDSVFRMKPVIAWDGMLVRVIATNSTDSAISTAARLRVIPDSMPPLLLGAFLQSNSLLVSFNKPLLPSSTTNLANYRVTNSTGADLAIVSAVLTNGTNVVLGIGAVSPDSYTLVVNGVRDTSIGSNLIPRGSSATIGFQLSIPFSAVWQFYTNNVDLGTAWTALDYSDTTGNWSSGPGLIADETTPPPEPILTPISRLDNGVYHYTFYFRYHLNAPVAAKTGVMTFRTVIDDGAIFYFNGSEFHRFNMAAGPVNYLTQANTNAIEGVNNGPFTATISNILAGDNVLAVEVHQNGTASADVTFGVELSLAAPSIVFPTALPPLLLSRITGSLVLKWPPSAALLEQTDLLTTNTVWATVTNQTNPYLIPPPVDTQRFYRLRQ